jgi:hypothetical protein
MNGHSRTVISKVGMLRIALDTDAVNRIADFPGILEKIKLASDSSHLIIIGNHVVRDQLAATSDPERRAHLLPVYDALAKRDVPTEGALWGISKWGESTFGDGGRTGISLTEAKTGGRGGHHDALIATTAAGHADVLVTNDGDLAKKIERSQAVCLVWSFNDFLRFLRAEGPD